MPYCREQADELDAMIDDYDPSAVGFLAVSREGSELSARRGPRPWPSATARRPSCACPIALDDGRMARAFGVGPIPHTAIFDREGKLRRVHQEAASRRDHRGRRRCAAARVAAGLRLRRA
ncbi:MAG: TlpA disulfide reductase family protein [Nannocystaceae bacterium]